jgi:hypothetical protein
MAIDEAVAEVSNAIKALENAIDVRLVEILNKSIEIIILKTSLPAKKEAQSDKIYILNSSMYIYNKEINDYILLNAEPDILEME